LRTWFGPDFALPPIRSLAGLIVVMSLALYPYVYLVARAAFLGQGRRLLEVARSLGLGPRAAFLRVGLPLAAPALAAGALLAMMEAVADFGTVAVFNQPSLTLAIYRAWYGLFALDAALRIATLLALAMLTLAWASQQLRRVALDARGGPVRRVALGRGAGRLAAGYAGLVFGLAFALPLVQLVIWAAPHLARSDGAALAAAARTLGLAGGAALFIVAFAGLAALATHRARGALARLAGAVLALGYALPGPVLAVALFVMLTGVGAWLAPGAAMLVGGTLAALLLGYYVRFAAVAQAPIAAGLAAAPPVLEQAARGLGRRGPALYLRLHLPLLRGAWLTALALVFVDVAKEMPLTLMLRPYGWDTLAVRIFEFTAEGDWARAAVPALGLVALGLVPVALLTRGVARS
jgi:iron(III) transport system permease protein